MQHRVDSEVFRTSLLRASPSGGARQAIEVYPVVLNVPGIAAGVYHYHPVAHALDALAAGPVDAELLVNLCGGQTAYLTGTALGLGVVFTAAIRDTMVEELLGLDWRHEIPCGVTGVGVPAAAEAARQDAMLRGAPASFSFLGDAWDGLGG